MGEREKKNHVLQINKIKDPCCNFVKKKKNNVCQLKEIKNFS